MRQLMLVEAGRVEWQEIPDPALEGPAEALVRPLAVALCDLDQPMIFGEAPIAAPVALGHEFVGEVVQTGDSVRSVAVGDRVVVPFQISCGECDFCRRGLTGDCTTVRRLSMYGFGALGGEWGGALSDLVRVPYADAMLVKLPASVDPATVASASDNIPDGWRTVGPQLERRPAAEVLVMGGGARSIALYAVQVALALGASRVVYADADPTRLALAERFGAEPLEGTPKRTGPFPVTVDAGGTQESLACALRSTEPGGVCTSVGIIYEPETPIPLLEMYTNGVEFRIGRVQARSSLPAVLEMVAAGKLHPEQVTSTVAPWAEAAEAVLERQTKLIISRDA